MTVLRSLLAAGAALSALAFAPAGQASCAPPPPLPRALAQANVAFVGTVVAVKHDGRTATFRVEEVWKGTVGETVVVHGGPGIAAIEEAARKGEGVATSVDRNYATGTRYLVLPWGRSGHVLLDNACTNTQRYSAELVGFRPPAAHAPPADGMTPDGAAPAADGGASWPAVVLPVALLMVAAAASLLVLRSRRATSAR
jgi:hypothetical protein